MQEEPRDISEWVSWLVFINFKDVEYPEQMILGYVMSFVTGGEMPWGCFVFERGDDGI